MPANLPRPTRTMPAPETPHLNHAVTCEMRRIGITTEKFANIAISGGGTQADFFAWLRSIPTNAGDEVFERRMSEERFAGAATANLPIADPDFVDEDWVELVEISREVDRIYPRQDRSKTEGFGYDYAGTRANTIQVLRAVPDGAGIVAMMAALEAGRRAAGVSSE